MAKKPGSKSADGNKFTSKTPPPKAQAGGKGAKSNSAKLGTKNLKAKK